MSAALHTSAPISAVKLGGEVPPTLFAAYMARLRCKQTRGGTALRSLVVLALGAGAVAAVRWDRGRQYESGFRDGQASGGSFDS